MCSIHNTSIKEQAEPVQIKNIFRDSIHVPGQRSLVLMLVNEGKKVLHSLYLQKSQDLPPSGTSTKGGRVYLSYLSIALGQFTISCFGGF